MSAVSAETLREAAALMREDWESASDWLEQSKAYNVAVADWLDAVAAQVTTSTGNPFFDAEMKHALAVARAYLGGERW